MTLILVLDIRTQLGLEWWSKVSHINSNSIRIYFLTNEVTFLQNFSRMSIVLSWHLMVRKLSQNESRANVQDVAWPSAVCPNIKLPRSGLFSSINSSLHAAKYKSTLIHTEHKSLCFSLIHLPQYLTCDFVALVKLSMKTRSIMHYVDSASLCIHTLIMTHNASWCAAKHYRCDLW